MVSQGYYKNCYNRRSMHQSLRPEQLRMARGADGMTQHQAAERPGVSQAYLALLERGRRAVTAQLGSRIAKLYGLGPLSLPLSAVNPGDWDSSSLAVGLASLGYPGFRQLTGIQARNP